MDHTWKRGFTQVCYQGPIDTCLGNDLKANRKQVVALTRDESVNCLVYAPMGIGVLNYSWKQMEWPEITFVYY